ncbi:MAG: insulinase family protein [Ignavibacteriales bacterium]|nr:insulinase family protein [Ignavibacteriales bacterium]
MSTKKFISLCVLLVFGAAFAFGQKQEPPQGSTPKDFKLPKKQVINLKNGITATLVPYGSMPKVSVILNIRAGNLNEAADQVWLADIMGDLMKEGTTSRTADAVAQEAASMGGAVNINVGPDFTTISGDVLSEFGPNLVALLADVTRNPRFPESEMARLKNDRLRQLNIAKTRPGQLTLEQFRRMLYPDHPYGRVFPTEEMLKKYTIDDVKGFYKANFGAARTNIYIAGRFDAKAMEQSIRESFENWQKGSAPLINIPKPVAKKALHLIDRPGAAQSTIYVGLPVMNPADKDYVKMLVTNSLLGGSFGSRITSNIREQKGYTYSPFSQISVRYRDAYWVEIADVTTDVTGPALKEIYKEINRLQTEAPPAEELKGIQNYVAGTFVLQNSSRGGIINQLSFLNLHGLKDDYLTNFVKNVHAITPADVQHIAQTQIRDKDMTLVITGDKKKIENQIAEYGKAVEEKK